MYIFYVLWATCSLYLPVFSEVSCCDGVVPCVSLKLCHPPLANSSDANLRRNVVFSGNAPICMVAAMLYIVPTL